MLRFLLWQNSCHLPHPPPLFTIIIETNYCERKLDLFEKRRLHELQNVTVFRVCSETDHFQNDCWRQMSVGWLFPTECSQNVWGMRRVIGMGQRFRDQQERNECQRLHNTCVASLSSAGPVAISLVCNSLRWDTVAAVPAYVIEVWIWFWVKVES
jgi:hypothetical protein